MLRAIIPQAMKTPALHNLNQQNSGVDQPYQRSSHDYIQKAGGYQDMIGSPSSSNTTGEPVYSEYMSAAPIFGAPKASRGGTGFVAATPTLAVDNAWAKPWLVESSPNR